MNPEITTKSQDIKNNSVYDIGETLVTIHKMRHTITEMIKKFIDHLKKIKKKYNSVDRFDLAQRMKDLSRSYPGTRDDKIAHHGDIMYLLIDIEADIERYQADINCILNYYDDDVPITQEGKNIQIIMDCICEHIYWIDGTLKKCKPHKYQMDCICEPIYWIDGTVKKCKPHKYQYDQPEIEISTDWLDTYYLIIHSYIENLPSHLESIPNSEIKDLLINRFSGAPITPDYDATIQLFNLIDPSTRYTISKKK